MGQFREPNDLRVPESNTKNVSCMEESYETGEVWGRQNNLLLLSHMTGSLKFSLTDKDGGITPRKRNLVEWAGFETKVIWAEWKAQETELWIRYDRWAGRSTDSRCCRKTMVVPFREFVSRFSRAFKSFDGTLHHNIWCYRNPECCSELAGAHKLFPEGFVDERDSQEPSEGLDMANWGFEINEQKAIDAWIKVFVGEDVLWAPGEDGR